jgi:hypothetical protein
MKYYSLNASSERNDENMPHTSPKDQAGRISGLRATQGSVSCLAWRGSGQNNRQLKHVLVVPACAHLADNIFAKKV